nr:GYD domain-containing protein [uncultured Methanospirillum sp.]
MLTFILLGRQTQIAWDQVAGFQERDKNAEEIITRAGGRLVSLHYTFGQYDFIAIIEAPSQEAMTRILMEIGRFGTFCSETLLALKPEQLYASAREIPGS